MSLNVSNFTYNGELIQSVAELIYDPIIESSPISQQVTIVEGIIQRKEVGFVGKGSLIGKLMSGCNLPFDQWNVDTRKKTWDPSEVGFNLSECYTQWDDTIAWSDLKKGIDRPDFTETAIMGIMTVRLEEAIAKWMQRLYWFSDKNAANYSSAGIITNGLDVAYFNAIDGFWKRLLGYTTANPKQLVPIAENANATEATQKINPDNIEGYLRALVYGAPRIMRSMPKSSLTIKCTQSFWDAYSIYLKGKELESTYSNLIDGNLVLYYDGYALEPIIEWDQNIYEYENNGTRLNQPNRALFTFKENLLAAVDVASMMSSFFYKFDEKEEVVWMRSRGMADTMIPYEDLFMLAI